MDFERIQRWTNYNDVKCKEYARQDFGCQCVYCLMNERDTGTGYYEYEIDHFFPKTKSEFYRGNVNDYNNLFYACHICNRKKSDFYDANLLNPCIDDIYFGENPALFIDVDDNYKVKANNPKGDLFINVFKLNSRHHITRRQKSALQKTNRKKMLNLLDEVVKSANDEIIDNVNQIKEIIKNQSLYNYELTDRFFGADEYLSSLNIKHKFIFEANNIDICIEINGIEYFCELIFDGSQDNKSTYEKRVKKEKLELWFKDERNIGILFFYYNFDKLYFVPLSAIIKSKQNLKDINIEKIIKLNDSYIITR